LMPLAVGPYGPESPLEGLPCKVDVWFMFADGCRSLIVLAVDTARRGRLAGESEGGARALRRQHGVLSLGAEFARWARCPAC